MRRVFFLVFGFFTLFGLEAVFSSDTDTPDSGKEKEECEFFGLLSEEEGGVIRYDWDPYELKTISQSHEKAIEALGYEKAKKNREKEKNKMLKSVLDKKEKIIAEKDAQKKQEIDRVKRLAKSATKKIREEMIEEKIRCQNMVAHKNSKNQLLRKEVHSLAKKIKCQKKNEQEIERLLRLNRELLKEKNRIEKRLKKEEYKKKEAEKRNQELVEKNIQVESRLSERLILEDLTKKSLKKENESLKKIIEEEKAIKKEIREKNNKQFEEYQEKIQERLEEYRKETRAENDECIDILKERIRSQNAANIFLRKENGEANSLLKKAKEKNKKLTLKMTYRFDQARIEKNQLKSKNEDLKKKIAALEDPERDIIFDFGGKKVSLKKEVAFMRKRLNFFEQKAEREADDEEDLKNFFDRYPVQFSPTPIENIKRISKKYLLKTNAKFSSKDLLGACASAIFPSLFSLFFGDKSPFAYMTLDFFLYPTFFLAQGAIALFFLNFGTYGRFAEERGLKMGFFSILIAEFFFFALFNRITANNYPTPYAKALFYTKKWGHFSRFLVPHILPPFVFLFAIFIQNLRGKNHRKLVFFLTAFSILLSLLSLFEFFSAKKNKETPTWTIAGKALKPVSVFRHFFWFSLIVMVILLFCWVKKLEEDDWNVLRNGMRIRLDPKKYQDEEMQFLAANQRILVDFLNKNIRC